MIDLGSLNPQQREAVVTVKGPVLILAGAGTGKTRVITHRIAHMIERGLSPDNILAVTFTNKAAREMKERVSHLIPRESRRSEDGPAPKPTVCTFHSLCSRILRVHIERLGYKRNFVIYNETEQLSALKKVMSAISARDEKTDPRPILSMISRIKNAGGEVPEGADEKVSSMAEYVMERYNDALKACNAVDFDDLLLLVLKLFKEHPAALDACRDRYRFIMVDEYQDTNGAQFQLVNQLSNVHRNLCVVGDDDQSIYGWRGAEIANLLDLEKFYPEVKVVKLEQNYRSTNVVLKAANAVIAKNPNRRVKNLWSQNGEGELIQLQSFDNEELEAKSVVEEIAFRSKAEGIRLGEFAILFRTNIQSRPVELALRKAEVRYNLIGGMSFFDRKEIKDFIAYLKLFLNPDDDVSLLRVANTPPRGLSDKTMQRLLGASQERRSSVYAAMKHTDVHDSMMSRIRGSILDFVDFVEETRGHLNPQAKGYLDQTPSLESWALGFLDEVGYWDELRKYEKTEEGAENRIRVLKDLISTMDSVGRPHDAPDTKLMTFLEDITLDNERSEEKELQGDAVTLITMHSCKGLEFPHCYIVGAEEGLIPHSRSKVEGTLDEERRLFYVALTRAKQTLRISRCDARKKFGEMTPCHPSSFLDDLPEDLTVDMDAKKNLPVEQERSKDLFAALRASLED